MVALVLTLGANVLRAASLFFVEAGLVPDAEPWWHEVIGLFAFALAAGATIPLLVKIRDWETRRGCAVATASTPARSWPSHTEFALFALAAVAAALAPLVSSDRTVTGAAAREFPDWPASFEGRPLVPLALSTREARFAEGFPGRIARFSDGNREIILRWVGEPTRKLHPAADCFKGSGYAIEPLPLRNDVAGGAFGCFRATKGAEAMTVCERIEGPNGATWSDASSWYWAALLGQSQGPWLSVVVGEKVPSLHE
jgi:MYXO-CTERM domain-containing protein